MEEVCNGWVQDEGFPSFCPTRKGFKAEPQILQCFGKSIKEVQQVEDGAAGTSKQGMVCGAQSLWVLVCLGSWSWRGQNAESRSLDLTIHVEAGVAVSCSVALLGS